MMNLSGIYSDKTIADKLMYIPNDYTQYYTFCILQLMVETFGHSTNQKSFKVPKVVKPANTKHYYKTLGTSVINTV